MSEQQAAEYLGISLVSLRQYARTRVIPSIVQIASPQRGGRRRRRYVYEFFLEALDAYDAKRREGNRQKKGGRKEGVTDGEIEKHLNDTTLTLAEIGRIYGLSYERIRQIGKKSGALDAKSRVSLRKAGRIWQQNQERYEKFLKNRPPWYRVFQEQCDERNIVFKPYTLLRGGELHFSYKTASCNGHLAHLHHGVFVRYKNWSNDYMQIHTRSAVPDAHFVVGVGVGKEGEEGGFYFWIIPGSFVNEWCKQRSESTLYLAQPRQVRRRFGHKGRENTHSPWAQWYDRWDLLV